MDIEQRIRDHFLESIETKRQAMDAMIPMIARAAEAASSALLNPVAAGGGCWPENRTVSICPPPESRLEGTLPPMTPPAPLNRTDGHTGCAE